MKIEIEGTEEVGTEPRASRTDQEIKQLALDVHAGQVFGSWNIPAHEQGSLGMVFMPLVLMGSLSAKLMERDGIVHLYEYLDKAGPRSINGMPCFFSMSTLNRDEFERMVAGVRKLEALSKAFMEDGDGAA